MKKRGKMKTRWISMLLSMSMLLSSVPVTAFAEGETGTVTETEICMEHHPEHTAECGYAAAVEGQVCGHVCTEECQQMIVECVHVHGENGCTFVEAQGDVPVSGECNHVDACTEESGCVTRVNSCAHTEHDEACGYIEAKEAVPCSYAAGCPQCEEKKAAEEETESESEKETETEWKSDEEMNDDVPEQTQSESEEKIPVDFMEYLDTVIPVIFQSTDDMNMHDYLVKAFGVPEEITFECSPSVVAFGEYEDGDVLELTVTGTGKYEGKCRVEAEVRYVVKKDFYAAIPEVTTINGTDYTSAIGKNLISSINAGDNVQSITYWIGNSGTSWIPTYNESYGATVQLTVQIWYSVYPENYWDLGNAGWTSTATGKYGYQKTFTISIKNAPVDLPVCNDYEIQYSGFDQNPYIRCNYGSISYSYKINETAVEKINEVGKYEVTAKLTCNNDVNVRTWNGWSGSGKNYTKLFTVTVSPYELKSSNVSCKGATEFTYDGTEKKPDICVTGYYSNVAITEGQDYTISWPEDTISAGNKTVTIKGKGNYYGDVTVTYEIKKKSPSYEKEPVAESGLIYDGKAQALVKEGTAQNGTIQYKTNDGNWSGQIPVAENAGTYTVAYRIKGNDIFADTEPVELLVIIAKQPVVPPTVSPEVYTGYPHIPVIDNSELYTVKENKGGTEGGSYPVVLTLKDPANYKWPNTESADLTLSFEITQIENEWTTMPSITGWTYGETAKTPAYQAKYGNNTVVVTYTGTANDGTVWNSIEAPEEAGNYTVKIQLAETASYAGLSAEVDFAISKANYDMSNAKWDYTEAFVYDGLEKKVSVTGLPEGVTVKSYTANKATNQDKYKASVTFDCDSSNYDIPTLADLEWEIINEWVPTEYEVNSTDWLNKDFVIIPAEGYMIANENTDSADWSNALVRSAQTIKEGEEVTFYLRNVSTKAISLPEKVTYYIDTTDPVGAIAIRELQSWDKLLDTITFGLFFNKIQTVEITADDILSGIRSIEYFESDRAYTEEELKQVTEWKEYNGSFHVSIEDAKKFVYFAKITDHAGNVIYLSTDGAIYDTSAPAADGVVNGGKYTTTQTVTVTDANLETLMLDGVDVTSPFVLEGNRDAIYTITATDKAGNSTTVSVVMQPVAVLDDTIEQMEPSTVTSDEKETIQSVLDQVDELLKDEDTAETEKAGLEEIKKEAEALKDAIEKAEAAVSTEEIKKVEDLDNSNVKPEDKSDIQAAKDALEQALKDNAGNYTEAEKSEIQQAISRLEGAAASIEKAEAVMNDIQTLPKSADTDMAEEEEEAILAVWEAYHALSEHERAMISEKDRTKLETLMEELTAYEIIKGDGSSWTKGSDKTLTFVANGAYRKYMSVGVDGKQIMDGGYTVEEGSTVVKLKPSYLETLSEGEYTITIQYTDGEAEGTFTVKAAAAEVTTETQEGAPATGDETNLVLWSVLMGMSVLGMAVLLFGRRRRSVK